MTVGETSTGCRIVKLPRPRKALVDALHVGVRRHMVHSLVEIDVTEARRRIREAEVHEGLRIELTAFLVGCVARALEEHQLVHSYRDWRHRRVSFDDVDVVAQVESEVDWVAAPHVINAANRLSVGELQEEIRLMRVTPAKGRLRKGLFARISRFGPGFVRRSFFRTLRNNPLHLQRTCGTALVSAIGMFGGVYGWSIGIVPLHTVSVAVGGLASKPGFVNGRVEPREFLALTVSVDHDLVDGPEAARFVRTLAGLVEAADGLPASYDTNVAGEPTH